MYFRLLGLDSSIFHHLHHVLDSKDSESKFPIDTPSKAYVRDVRDMAATPADIKEYASSCVFVVNLSGLKFVDIKVHIDYNNSLLISGERKREVEEGAAKYLLMERRVGKFMRKFLLPENANTDKISAVCQDGVLIVTVDKLSPSEPKKTKTIEIKIS